MKTHKNLLPGKAYVVTSAEQCTISTPDGVVITTHTPGAQTLFIAPTAEVVVSDDAAKVTEAFKGASLSVAGGGGNSGGGTITVDQTFNPSSTNAQSGVAVQDGLDKRLGPLRFSEDNVLEYTIPADAAQQNDQPIAVKFTNQQGNTAIIAFKGRQVTLYKAHWYVDGDFIVAGGVKLNRALTVNGAATLTDGLVLAGAVDAGGTFDSAELKAMNRAAALYWGTQYSWTRANVERDFCGDDGLTCLPDDTPEPTSLATATIIDSTLFQSVKLKKFPKAWTFGAATQISTFAQSSALESLPENMLFTNVTVARSTFAYCSALSSISEAMTLENLKYGISMFYGCALTRLPAGMTLSNLINGRTMFAGTKNALTSAPGVVLSSLVNGSEMFSSSRFGLDDAVRMINSLKTATDETTGELNDWVFTIGVNASLRENAELTAAVAAATSRGWTVMVKYFS